MIRKMLFTFLVLFLLIPLPVMGDTPASGDSSTGDIMSFDGTHDSLWHLKAHKPFLIGGYGDNFNYDGSNVVPLLGKAVVILDADKDNGTMYVNIKGTIHPQKGKTLTGEIEIYYRITKGGPAFREGGVADFIYLHGDTQQEPPVMPKVRTFLGAWGTADVYVNGKLIYSNLDGHMMYTERSRDLQTRAIYNNDRTGFYSQDDPSNASIADPQGRELHFVMHNKKHDKKNFPPDAVWIHINFEKAIDMSSDGDTCEFMHRKGPQHMKHGAPGCGHHMMGGKCGAGCGCGCNEGGMCGMDGGKCGAGCACGCIEGKTCTMTGPGHHMKHGATGGGHHMMGGKCGAGCGCGCNEGGMCGMDGGKCGAGCGCGCSDGKACAMKGPGHHMKHGAPGCGHHMMGGKCGAGCGCGCNEGGMCGMDGGKCAAGCACGCIEGKTCTMR